MTIALGSVPVHCPTAVKPVLVQRSVSEPTCPLVLPTPVQRSPLSVTASNEIWPENESAPANPLMAPVQSDAPLVHTPSTQLPPCTTVIVIVRVEKFSDSKVPLQFPAMLTTGPGSGAGEGVAGDAEHPLAAPSTSAMTTAPTVVRIRTHGSRLRRT
jgi:hypothetical protein